MVSERLGRSSIKLLIGFLFFMFFLYQIIQHSLVFLYHDDYGYASLQYGTLIGTGGLEYGLADILSYLKWHYFNWGGRVLYFFLEILLIRLGGLPLIRLVQAAVITGIVYETYLLARRRGKDNILLAMTSILLWGGFSVKTLRDGVYWFTASVLYVWPLVFFLAGILIENEFIAAGRRRTRNALLFAFFFLAAFSQEQVAVMTVVYCLVRMAVGIFGGHKIQLACLAGAAAGGAVEILAPGNFVRAAEEGNAVFFSKSMFEKICYSLPRIGTILFGPNNIMLAVIVGITAFMAGIVLWKIKKQKKWALAGGMLGFSYPLVCLAGTATGTGGLWLYAVILVWAFALLLWFLYCFWMLKEPLAVALFICGVCSQLALIVSPAVSQRSAAIFQLVFNCIFLCVFRQAMNCCEWKRCTAPFFTASYLLAAVISAFNIIQIGAGYYRNAGINRQNDRILSEAAHSFSEGEQLREVTQYKMYDDDYAGDMPYNKSYIEYWIKGYYNLPPDMEFKYEESWRRNG